MYNKETWEKEFSHIVTCTVDYGGVSYTEVYVWSKDNISTGEPMIAVNIMFTDKKVFVTGEWGSYIFGRNIQNPLTFFCGNQEPNYGYWGEKVEAAPIHYYEREVDENLLYKNLNEMLAEKEIKDTGDNIYSDRDTAESWYDAILEASDDRNWELDSEDIDNIVSSSLKPDTWYIKTCDILRYVSNYILDKTH